MGGCISLGGDLGVLQHRLTGLLVKFKNNVITVEFSILLSEPWKQAVMGDVSSATYRNNDQVSEK